MPRLRSVPRGRGRQGAQSLVETALVLPLFILIVFGIIDFGRFVYIRGTLESDTRESGRLLTLAANRNTDCPSQQYVLVNDNDIVNSVDPNSTWGNGSAASVPAAGSGYIYINPAVAQSAATCTAAGANMRAAGTVTVTITYRFVALTPVISTLMGPVTMSTSSTQPTEY